MTRGCSWPRRIAEVPRPMRKVPSARMALSLCHLRRRVLYVAAVLAWRASSRAAAVALGCSWHVRNGRGSSQTRTPHGPAPGICRRWVDDVVGRFRFAEVLDRITDEIAVPAPEGGAAQWSHHHAVIFRRGRRGKDCADNPE